jgi:hypothetical protein
MNLPLNSFHVSNCAALARFHLLIGLRAKDASDARYHEDRGEAFRDCMSLEPYQMRMVINLSENFPIAFGFVRGRLVAHKGSPAGPLRQGH